MAAPLYGQVADALRSRISQHWWREGDRLPSESELCHEFGVSSITMRRAVANLVAEGLLVRWQGKGTFVTLDHGVVQGPPRLSSFTQDMHARGWKASARVGSIRTEHARPDVATKLGLTPSALVTVIERVRLADGAPMAIQTVYLPALLFPGLEKYHFEHASLYATLEREYGVYPANATETYHAIKVARAEARLLEIPAGSPAFSVERITSDARSRRIELVDALIRGDKYTLAISLSAAGERGTAE